jgi:hypothetical protein
MANPRVTSGQPHGVTAQVRGPTGVTLISTDGPAMSQRRVSTAPNRTSKWIVQVVMVLTSAFALLDVFLLVASGHH